MLANKLRDFNILVVDADLKLANVLCDVLKTMGFTCVTPIANGEEALTMLRQKPYDFMITEWNTRGIDGIELLNHIRRHNGNNQTLPIIMLTGRAEKADVITARDYGINEYVVKPFSAKTVFSRIERLIEMPRNFVLSKFFIGPDRRGKTTLPPKGTSERRTAPIKPITRTIASTPDDSATKIWLADYSLKSKLGRDITLSSVVTVEMLEKAQQTIQAVSDESMEWINENLDEIKALNKRMQDGDHYTLLPMDISEVALTLSSRAGTFGFLSASKVAYLLHLFSRNRLRMEDPDHQMVTAKHLEALHVTLASKEHDLAPPNDHIIINQLRALVEKYAA